MSKFRMSSGDALRNVVDRTVKASGGEHEGVMRVIPGNTSDVPTEFVGSNTVKKCTRFSIPYVQISN